MVTATNMPEQESGKQVTHLDEKQFNRLDEPLV